MLVAYSAVSPVFLDYTVKLQIFQITTCQNFLFSVPSVIFLGVVHKTRLQRGLVKCGQRRG